MFIFSVDKQKFEVNFFLILLMPFRHRYMTILEKKKNNVLKSFYKKSPTLPHLNSLSIVFEKAILNISSSIWCPSVPKTEKMSFFVTVLLL